MINCRKLNSGKWLLMIFFGIIFIYSISIISLAQEEEKEESTVNLSSNSVVYDKGTDKMVFTGNVQITQDDIVLTAMEAEFDVDKKVGQINGNIKMIQSDITITGEFLEAFLNDKRYVFSEKVKLIQARKGEEEEEDNIIWDCNNLEIFTDTKNITASENVKILKKDYNITTDKAVYNEALDKIDLTGRVRIEEANGRWISGDNAVFYVETERLEVQGNVESGINLD